MSSMNSEVPIAIIGMACRFGGGATDPEKLWKLVADGQSAWSEIPSSRFNVDGVWHPFPQKLNNMNVRGGHFLTEDVGLFDAGFFGLSAEVAASLDPQFRLQLESTYEALENAGLKMEEVAGSNTSMFGGTFFRDYHDGALRDPETLPRFLLVGVGSAMASNRVSHFYDLRGASMSLDTGCSTTLVGLHQACQNLRAGESDMSIVGGANVILNPDNFIAMSSLGLISPSGRSYAFDDRASGYGRGEGSATVVLKRLDDAIRDGDPIRSVIRGTGSNQDGKTDTITTPSQQAQEQLIRRVYATSGLDPRDTTYFEAHGTGTPTGDPIECRAVNTVFTPGRPRDQPLRIGSVKTNVGHTETTSGLASIIKVTLALEKDQIPPSINFENPNPNIDLEGWNLTVPRQVEQWPAYRDVRRASVNNFGYGGANAHVILESYASYMAGLKAQSSVMALESAKLSTKLSNGLTNGHYNGSYLNNDSGSDSGAALIFQSTTDDEKTCPKLVALSAKDEQTAQNMIINLRNYLAKTRIVDKSFYESLVYTLGERRSMFNWVTTLTASNTHQLIEGIDAGKAKPVRVKKQPRIGFVFTGQGAQWYAMGRELITAYPVFRDCLLEAQDYLTGFGCSWSLMEELLKDAETSRVDDPVLSMPLCAAVQIALVRLLRSWGITASAVTSHSSGEIAAAYTAGSLTLRDAMAIVFARGSVTGAGSARVSGKLAGGMLAVGLSAEQTAEEYLPRVTAGKVVIACYNSPTSITASGDVGGIEQLEGFLKDDGIFARRLKVNAAYHSHHMTAIQDEYLAFLNKFLAAEEETNPHVLYTSPATGDRVLSGKILSRAGHWVRSLVYPVQFVQAFMSMCLGDHGISDADAGNLDCVIEVGPHSALGGPIADICAQPEFKDIKVPYYSCLVRKKSAVETMQALACSLLRAGHTLNMNAINFPSGKEGVVVLQDLPPYPWNHNIRHWAETRYNKSHRERREVPHDLLGSMAIGTNPLSPTWRLVIRPLDMPWVRDHVIQGTMLYPGGGFICMAIEGACQTVLPSLRGQITGIELRDIDIMAALVVPDNAEGIEMQMSFCEAGDASIHSNFQQFKICSVTSENKWTEHCKGFIKLNYTQGAPSSVPEFSPRKMSDYRKRLDARDIYSSMHAVGLQHGTMFQNLREIRADTDQSVAVVEISDTAASMPYQHQHEHIIHPVTLDNVFQAVYTALPDAGSKMHHAMLPRSIKKLWISTEISCSAGDSLRVFPKASDLTGQGFNANISVTADKDDSTDILLAIEKFTFQSIGAALPQTSNRWETEKFSRLIWASDFTMASPETTQKLLKSVGESSSRGFTATQSQLCELVKEVTSVVPRGNILEINARSGELTQHILGAIGTSYRDIGMAASSYTFTDPSAEGFKTIEDTFVDWSDLLTCSKLDIQRSPESQGLELHSYDLVIASLDGKPSKEVLANINSLLRHGGRCIVVKTSVVSSPADHDEFLRQAGFEVILTTDAYDLLTMSKVPQERFITDDVVIVTLNTSCSFSWLEDLSTSIRDITGKKPSVESLETVKSDGRLVILLAELETPILMNPTEAQFNAVKSLCIDSKGLLWVTKGGMVECKNLEASINPGLLRCLRVEYQGKRLASFDLDSSEESSTTALDITKVFSKVFNWSNNDFAQDFEFAIRNGKLLVPRYIVDEERNKQVFHDGSSETVSMTVSFNNTERSLKLVADRFGAVESLVFADGDWIGIQDLNDGLEISPHAFGLDSQQLVGILGQSGKNILTECSGIVTRLQPGASNRGFKVGDRVVALYPGSIQNKVIVSSTKVARIPDGISFEDAASLPLASTVAEVTLRRVARLHKNETVLIHAAKGCIGQVIIDMAKSIGAHVIVIVGTDEEERLSMERAGIPATHIISDQDMKLSSKVNHITNGHGCEVVVSLLNDSLLRASADILAPFGRFINLDDHDAEKKSPLDLSLLRRGVSFTSVDLMSWLELKEFDLEDILGDPLRALQSNASNPVVAVNTFPVSLVHDAYREIAAGNDVGKVVLTVSPSDVVEVKPHMKMAEFREDASYLVVGGLGGIGQATCHWMAQRGVKNLIILSRSAGAKASSMQKVLAKEGCTLKAVSCDIANSTDVARVIAECAKDMPPIRGVIQGAMVLQDSILEQMTAQDYIKASRPKIQGSWNLHEQLQSHDLDFFVILSSVAAVVGFASQCNYAAGGVYEDSLARYRTLRGLPCVSLDIGVVLNVGVVAEHDAIEERLRKSGNTLLSEGDVMKAIESSIVNPPASGQVIIGLNPGPGPHWENSGMARDTRFLPLKYQQQKTSAVTTGGVSDLSSLISAAESFDDAMGGVLTALCGKLEEIFQVTAISTGDSVADIGVDSLVAVELRNMLALKAGAQVSIFDIMSSASVMGLAKVATGKSTFLNADLLPK